MRYIKTQNEQTIEYSGPQMGAAWYASNGWIKYTGSFPVSQLDIIDGAIVELPPPAIPGQPEFEDACVKFRALCATIGVFIGDANFKGGFDDYGILMNSPAFEADPLAGNTLALLWTGANELCKYTGAKIGLGQPEWWYRCWELGELSGGSSSVEQA